jgi:ribosomal protein S6
MNKYELLLVLPGTFSDAEAETKAQEIMELLKNFSEDAKLFVVGKNRLSYPINNIRYGYFSTIVFQSESEQVEALKAKLLLVKDLLRSTIVKLAKNAKNNTKITYFTDGRTAATLSKNKENYNTREVRKVIDQKEEVLETVKEEKIQEEVVGQEEKVVKITEKEEKSDFNLQDIDKKLDEILSDDNIIAGV